MSLLGWVRVGGLYVVFCPIIVDNGYMRRIAVVVVGVVVN
jgi:hypothetical protein